MRYRVMEAEQKKKPGSVLRQNAEVTAPSGHTPSTQLQKNLLAAQAGLGNRYVQRIIARLQDQQEHKENIQPVQTDLVNLQGGKRENHTGLPDPIKLGIEQLSGYSLDDVRVHYNSSRPEELQALAYTQGTHIYVAPGQERHLPHEAWHVVQQAQGRVKPTSQLKSGVAFNDETMLECEADVMGARAVGTRHALNLPQAGIDHGKRQISQGKFVTQRVCTCGHIPHLMGCQEYHASPSTDERTKNAKVGDRHNPPHPFMDLGGWYKTLMTGRIADLYRTSAGLPGHVIAVQLQLNWLNELIDSRLFRDEKSFNSAKEYETRIKQFIIQGAKEAPFDFSKELFRFSGASVIRIEKANGTYSGSDK